MGFTEKIIEGKEKKIAELEEIRIRRQHEFEDLETQYTHLSEQKNALEES
jgi:hypothetical protein